MWSQSPPGTPTLSSHSQGDTHLNIVLGDEGNVELRLQKSGQPEASEFREKTRAEKQRGQ